MARGPAIQALPFFQRIAFCTFTNAMDAHRADADPADMSTLQLQVLYSKFNAVAETDTDTSFDGPADRLRSDAAVARDKYAAELKARGVDPEAYQ